MPDVQEGLPTIAVGAQHSCYFAVLFEVEGVIPVELDGISRSGCSRLICIEILLSVFNSLFGCDSHWAVISMGVVLFQPCIILP